MPMNTGMTEDHRVQLQQIQQRDKEMDRRYLDQIEKGVEDLRDIALRANEVREEGREGRKKGRERGRE
eukprot:evm.model.NODE_32964_length_50150_cov_18.993917.14